MNSCVKTRRNTECQEEEKQKGGSTISGLTSVTMLADPSEVSEEETFQESMPARKPAPNDASHGEDSIGFLQEMHVDSIDGCDEKVEE